MTTLRFTPTALALGLFLVVTFTLCVIWGLLFPHTSFQQALLGAVFPGFAWLSWTSFLVGLAESFLYGIFIAAIFVPLYGGLNRWTSQTPSKA